jgi:hypothetical protein
VCYRTLLIKNVQKYFPEWVLINTLQYWKQTIANMGQKGELNHFIILMQLSIIAIVTWLATGKIPIDVASFELLK